MPYVRVHCYCPGLCCNSKKHFFLLYKEGNGDAALFHFRRVLEKLCKEQRQVWHQRWRLPFTKIPGVLWAHVTSAAGAEQKPWEHIFAFGSRLLSPGFTADSPAASAGRGCVQGNGKVSRAVWAVPCIAFYSVSLPGSRNQFPKGTFSRSSGLDESLAEYEYTDKIPACRLISEAFSQVREINSR